MVVVSSVIGSQTYQKMGGQGVFSMVQTPDDGFALAGSTKTFDRDGDFWLVKTDEYGIPEFPSWTPFLLVIGIVAVVLVVYKRRLHKTLNN